MAKVRMRCSGMGLLFTLAALFACSGRPVPSTPHTLTIAVENDIQTLDPAILSDPFTSRILWQMYEGLLGLDAQGVPIPLIAESWQADHGFRHWTFKLRPSVYYHESPLFAAPSHTRPVNAYDVLYSYHRFAAGFGSFVFSGVVEGFTEFVKHQTDSVKGFVVLDSLTFQFRLLQAEPTFVYRLASPYLGIMPPEVVEHDPHRFGRTICVGSGPFKLLRRTETEVLLERHPRYWRRTLGNLQQILFRVEKNPQLRINQFESRVYDVLQVPIAFIPRYVRGEAIKPELANRYRLLRGTTYNVHYLGLNCRDLQDVHLRRAIAFAVNKAEIVRSLLYDQAQIATSPVPPGMQGYQPPEGLRFNPDSCRQELAASAYRGEPLTVLVSDAPNSEQLGQIIQSDLARVGIRTTLQKLDFNSLLSRIFSGDKPDLFILFSEWIFSAPEFIIESYHSERWPNPNLFGYRNPWVDQQLNEWRKKSEREQINAICRRAESVALSEAPAVWLFHLYNLYVTDHRLTQFNVNANHYWDLADALWQEE
ncbi:MAG TPA: ABC transporter substrate-binding protein [bacterium]|nr:ABC transporter substrate-binding protein [bacterium]HPN34125.1 ABC transporter substrate-binding protein [bacterium]